jgi:hypothetical protein
MVDIMDNQSEKPKRKPPTEKQYREAEIGQALIFCPEIYPCANCGWPVIDGYCCEYCDCTNPREKDPE